MIPRDPQLAPDQLPPVSWLEWILFLGAVGIAAVALVGEARAAVTFLA